MPKVPVLALVALVALVALALPPAARAEFRPVPNKEYREYFNQPNPVKGEALVGVAVVPRPEAQRSSTLQVFFGQPYDGPVSVETATADGTFRGAGEFVGATTNPGWQALPLDTVPAGQGPGRPADPEALAVAARGQAPNEFRVVHWGDGPVSEADLMIRLYVNGRRGDMSVQAGEERFRCNRVKGQRLLRFDAYCDLPWGSIPADGAITLIRRDGFNVLPQSVVIVR